MLRRFLAWVRFVMTPNVWPERWQDRVFTGHFRIGRVTIYGANAMHWAVNIRGRRAYWCFHPPTRTFGGRWPAYFYISPDATPQSSTFCLPRAYGRCD